SVPGCHATGFLLLIHPLVQAGIIPKHSPITCNSLTGYSGGGRSLIGQHEMKDTAIELLHPQPYSLNLNHKHSPEMRKYAQLDSNPIFIPIVTPFYNGMLVTVPIPISMLNQALKRK